MKRLLIAAFLVQPFMASSQELNIGDTLPELQLCNVINHSSDTIRLSEYKGKLLILDFWATNCSGCLASFPKIDSLQKKFSDKLQFVLVTKQTAEQLNIFFTRRKWIQLPHVPVITGDTILSSLLPYFGMPFHVWIDKAGRILYKLSSPSTNDLSLAKYLSGQELELTPYTNHKFFVEPYVNTSYVEKLISSSILAKCRFGNPKSYPPEAMSSLVSWGCKCLTVPQLYKSAYNEGKNRFFYNYQMDVRVIDSTKHFLPDKLIDPGKWYLENTYNYELLIPKQRKSDLYKIFQSELQKTFGWKANVEWRAFNGWALVKIFPFQFKTTKGPQVDSFYRTAGLNKIESPVRFVRNIPFSFFSARLQNWIQLEHKVPFRDETGIDSNVDISLPGPVIESLDITLLKRELNKLGLDLVPRKIEAEVLCLEEAAEFQF